MMNFEILITSPPDRKNIVAEVWHNNKLIAEINNEREDIEIEIYPSENLTFNFHEFVSTLEIARKKLENR